MRKAPKKKIKKNIKAHELDTNWSSEEEQVRSCKIREERSWNRCKFFEHLFVFCFENEFADLLDDKGKSELNVHVVFDVEYGHVKQRLRTYEIMKEGRVESTEEERRTEKWKRKAQAYDLLGSALRLFFRNYDLSSHRRISELKVSVKFQSFDCQIYVAEWTVEHVCNKDTFYSSEDDEPCPPPKLLISRKRQQSEKEEEQRRRQTEEEHNVERRRMMMGMTSLNYQVRDLERQLEEDTLRVQQFRRHVRLLHSQKTSLQRQLEVHKKEHQLSQAQMELLNCRIAQLQRQQEEGNLKVQRYQERKQWFINCIFKACKILVSMAMPFVVYALLPTPMASTDLVLTSTDLVLTSKALSQWFYQPSDYLVVSIYVSIFWWALGLSFLILSKKQK
jgi:hypothetical protein